MLDKLMMQYTLNRMQKIYTIGTMGFYNYFLTEGLRYSLEVFNLAVGLTFNSSFTEQQRKALGWNLTQVLNSCTFNGIKCDVENDFEWYFSVDYGNCYRFNSRPTNFKVIRK
jgi:hypothetical protein